MRCPQGGLGQVLAEISVKGERLRSMTLEELGSTSGIFLLDFISSCSLSWANGEEGSSGGYLSMAYSVFEMNVPASDEDPRSHSEFPISDEIHLI
jgi:hypothetical protein